MKNEIPFLREVAKELPIIRPIKEFIHLNLLLPYQHQEFWDALKEVSHKLEANPFPDLTYFRNKIESGEIPTSVLGKSLEKKFGESAPKALDFIMHGKFDFIHHDTRKGRLHDMWNTALGFNVMEQADGMLIKWLSMFLDQGIGHWQMPYSSELSFYQCIQKLLNSSFIVPEPFNRKTLDSLFPDNSHEAISKHLHFLCPQDELKEAYMKESLLTLRGWAGLIYNIQEAPHLLPFKRRITLEDFLAVKLCLERAWIEHEKGRAIIPDFASSNSGHDDPEILDKWTFDVLRCCQEVLEEVTYDKLLRDLLTKEPVRIVKKSAQAVFCMDDRESSLRAHLEHTNSSIETFGTAGHFGIECLYQHPDDAFPKKQCPAPMPAKFLLKDYFKSKKNVSKKMNVLPDDSFGSSGHLLKDWFLAHLNAFSSVVKLSTNLFFPLAFKSLENIREIELETELKVGLSSNEPSHGLPEGLTLDQMTDVVYQQLLLIGLVNHFSSLIFIIGHGSQSENNPYFATYGCGACSGRSGAANARAFVTMANNQDVRDQISAKYNLLIPRGVYFVSGFHDTCRDIVEFYNSKSIPSELVTDYEKFKKYLKLALYKNAKSRSQLFKLVSYGRVNKEAQKEVIRRSHSLFETRPEMGHTNVAFAIVGKREGLRAFFPEKPSFFQSYDPEVDPQGKLLAITLGAVIPVCSGINLDYYFSRVDNLRFGAGSKLPQNIVGNFGVSHGTESDLLFGLPFQMIDQHTPLRLLVLVEQSKELALAAIEQNPLVKQIVYNNWIYYGCYNKDERSIYMFQNGSMVLKENLMENV